MVTQWLLMPVAAVSSMLRVYKNDLHIREDTDTRSPARALLVNAGTRHYFLPVQTRTGLYNGDNLSLSPADGNDIGYVVDTDGHIAIKMPLFHEIADRFLKRKSHIPYYIKQYLFILSIMAI